MSVSGLISTVWKQICSGPENANLIYPEVSRSAVEAIEPDW